MKTTTQNLSFILLFLILCSCHRTISGTINCKDIQTYTSGYGILNSIHANIGDIYYINQKDKFAGYVFHVPLDTTDILHDGRATSMVIDANIDLQATLDASTTQMQILSAKIEEMIERESKLKLTNPVRVRVNTPYGVLSKIENQNLSVFERLNTKDTMFMLITSVVFSDEIVLQTSNSDTTSTQLRTLKVDGVTVKLTCNCNAIIDIDGQKASTFFKAVFFTYDKSSKKLIPYTQLFDFKGYKVNTVNQ